MTKPVRLDCGASVGAASDVTTYALVDLSEAQIRDLATGYVPKVIQAMAMSCLNWADEDDRRARR